MHRIFSEFLSDTEAFMDYSHETAWIRSETPPRLGSFVELASFELGANSTANSARFFPVICRESIGEKGSRASLLVLEKADAVSWKINSPGSSK